MKSQFITTTIDKITKEGVENSNTKIAETGDIVLVTRISPGPSAGFVVNDLRFGKVINWKTGEGDFVFRYNIDITTDPATITQAEQSFEGGSEMLAQLWQRMSGKREFQPKE